MECHYHLCHSPHPQSHLSLCFILQLHVLTLWHDKGVKPVAQNMFDKLKPLPIPACSYTDIRYDMIVGLLLFNRFDSILTVFDQLANMAPFIPCTETMVANQLADLMLKLIWTLCGTPKTIVFNQGGIFILQVTKEPHEHLGINLHPSKAYPSKDQWTLRNHQQGY